MDILNLKETTVGEIVAGNHRTAELFRKYKIDFCCGGKRKLTDVIAEKGIDAEPLLNELTMLVSSPQRSSQNYAQWDSDFLIDYIINTHHRYLRSAMPSLTVYSKKVAKVHGNEHPEVIEVARVFEQLVNELDPHLLKEEEILFPYIRQMVHTQRLGQPVSASHFGTVSNPVQMMEVEHEEVGEMMRIISELTNQYTPPADACNTYRVLYAGLKEFEEDLHQHVHLENNILFKKATELEMPKRV